MDQGIDAGFAAHVGFCGNVIASEFLFQLINGLLRSGLDDVADHHLRPNFGKALADSPSNTAGSTGYNCYFPI